MYAIGGLLKHAPALCAITNPTTNSYKRLVPGYEAPVNLAYSRRNRSASIRIPVYSPSPKAKRIEFRCPDGSSNPYLAFSAMLMAMLDGIKNKIKPGEPLDKDIYDLEPEELAKVPKTPGSLDEALNNLEKDHEFLLQGDVFTERRDQHLDLVQAREGSRRDPPAAAPVRVRAVLRHLRRRAGGVSPLIRHVIADRVLNQGADAPRSPPPKKRERPRRVRRRGLSHFTRALLGRRLDRFGRQVRRVVGDLDRHLQTEGGLGDAVEWLPVADPERIEGRRVEVGRGRLVRGEAARVTSPDRSS